MIDDFEDDCIECDKCHGQGTVCIAPEGFHVHDGDTVVCPVCDGEGFLIADETSVKGSAEND